MSDVQDEVVTPVETPVATPEPVATAPEPTAGQDSEKKPEAKTFTEDDVNKIVQKRLAKESRRIQREVQLEVENSVLRQQAQPAPKPVGEPKVDDFKDYDSYNKALINSTAEEVVDRKVEEKLAQIQRSQQEAQARQAQSAQREKLEKAASKYEDFEDIALHNPDLIIDKPSAAFILESDRGADVAYYLGSNLNEARKIAAMSPIQQIRALAQIEAKFETPAKKPSSAPEPVKPIGSGASLTKDVEKMSMAEYKDWRRKQGARF